MPLGVSRGLFRAVSRMYSIGSAFSLLGDGSTLITTGADSPWNQLANLEALASDLSSLLFVLLKAGINDHLSLAVDDRGDDGGERSDVMEVDLVNNDGGRLKPFNCGFCSFRVCVVGRSGSCVAEIDEMDR